MQMLISVACSVIQNQVCVCVRRCSRALIAHCSPRACWSLLMGGRGFSRLFEVYVSDCVESPRRALDKHCIQSKDWPH